MDAEARRALIAKMVKARLAKLAEKQANPLGVK